MGKSGEQRLKEQNLLRRRGRKKTEYDISGRVKEGSKQMREKENRKVREQTQTLLLKVCMRDRVYPTGGRGADLRLRVHADVSSTSAEKVRLYEARAQFVNSVARDGPAQLMCAGGIKADGLQS